MLALHHRTAGIYSAQSRRVVYSYKENKVHVSLSEELMSCSQVTLNLLQTQVLLVVKYWYREQVVRINYSDVNKGNILENSQRLLTKAAMTL